MEKQKQQQQQRQVSVDEVLALLGSKELELTMLRKELAAVREALDKLIEERESGIPLAPERGGPGAPPPGAFAAIAGAEL